MSPASSNGWRVTTPKARGWRRRTPTLPLPPLPGPSRTWPHLSDEAELLAAFAPALSARDQEVLARPPYTAAILRDMQEAFRQGLLGGGWDNVAWIGPWDFAIDAVLCPVLLWYGDEDLMARPVMGTWLEEHLPDAQLTMRQGYGHLSALEHLPEMLAQLTATRTQS